jgi:hypothetical protein
MEVRMSGCEAGVFRDELLGLLKDVYDLEGFKDEVEKQRLISAAVG